ncbi:MAG: hypothetical protein WC314_15960 [Vulcanimicrobiota bacterium]
MNSTFGKFLVGFMLATLVAASAMPTMAGRLKSYDGSTGILLLEMEDKTVRKFQLTDKTKVEWMGRNTTAGALRQGAKISIQVLGSLGASPLKAGKIVDWGNSEKIVAKGATAPYHTAVAEYATTSGGGGTPDGAPKMNSTAHQDMAAIAQGGSQNQPTGPNGYSTNTGLHSNPQAQPSYPAANPGGSQMYTNQGQSMTAPLEMMNIDPFSAPAQMGMNDPYSASQMGLNPDPGTMMGLDDGSGDSSVQPMPGMETAYGGGTQKITGQILEAAIENGYVVLQSFEHPNLIRVLLHQANAPMQYLTPGQMIEVVGEQTPQGFRATEIKAAGGYQ